MPSFSEAPIKFSLYSEAILQAVIISGHYLNNIRYADVRVLIAETERKVQELLQKAVKENEQNGLDININKTKWMVTSKRKTKKFELLIGDTNIKQLQNFKKMKEVI